MAAPENDVGSERGVWSLAACVTNLMTAALLIGLSSTGALAERLEEAFARAYLTNPQLGAARAQLRAIDEQVPQARAGYLPTITGTADIGRQETTSSTGGASFTPTGAILPPAGTTVTTPRGFDVTLAQPIFRGGSIAASVRRAESLVAAQRASLIAAEQSVLLATATAYVNVVRDQSLLELAAKNEQVLGRQLDVARARFDVGEVTRTDVSQAESRRSRAAAGRIAAEAQLALSRAAYFRVVGHDAGALTMPALPAGLPNSKEELISLAQAVNPSVVAAIASAGAAEESVAVLRGQLLPSVTLSGQVAQRRSQGRRTFNPNTASANVKGTMPIYEGGAITARVREAKQIHAQRESETEEAVRRSREEAVRAWEAFANAKASVGARQTQVSAAEIALNGVEQESLVGSRTVLDVLNAEQELLNAEVSLVGDQATHVAAGFQMLAAMGKLTASGLKLPVDLYDPKSNYLKVRNRLWGTDIPNW